MKTVLAALRGRPVPREIKAKSVEVDLWMQMGASVRRTKCTAAGFADENGVCCAPSRHVQR